MESFDCAPVYFKGLPSCRGIPQSSTRFPCDSSTGYFSCIDKKSILPNACNCDSTLGKWLKLLHLFDNSIISIY